MGKIFEIEYDYGTWFAEYIKNPPVAIINDIDETIQIRLGFCAGIAFFSNSIHYDDYQKEIS